MSVRRPTISFYNPGEPGVLLRRDLPEGRVLDVVPLTFDRARLQVGPANSQVYDDGW